MDRDELLDMVMELVQEDDSTGICTSCHEVAYNVEPDAEGYECESCGALKVCGAEMYVLMNVP
jgi:hypothetical protein